MYRERCPDDLRSSSFHKIDNLPESVDLESVGLVTANDIEWADEARTDRSSVTT